MFFIGTDFIYKSWIQFFEHRHHLPAKGITANFIAGENGLVDDYVCYFLFAQKRRCGGSGGTGTYNDQGVFFGSDGRKRLDVFFAFELLGNA